MGYLTHILPDTVSGDTKKIQSRFIGHAFAIRNEQIVEYRNLADKPSGKVTETNGGRKITGLQYIFFGPSAFLVIGLVIRFRYAYII